jgi:hypothetical protein
MGVTRTHACRGLIPAALFLCGLSFAAQAGRMIVYHLEASSPLSRFSSGQLALLAKLNRADSAHLSRLPRIVVPNRWVPDELLYSPMPQVVPQLSDEMKAIVVDLAAQVFGAYESGRLVRWGPVSSGARHRQTPPGTYHLNWHQRVRVSSENPTWIMPWYFNFSSTEGLGLHQYSLPGRPASHGCVRMLATDAKWLFNWGKGWMLADGSDEPAQPGTLVLILGTYDFRSPQPWLQPKWWARGVSLPAEQIASRK